MGETFKKTMKGRTVEVLCAGEASSCEGGSRKAKAISKKDTKRLFLDGLYRDHWVNLCGWLRKRYGVGPPSPEDIAQTAFAKLAAQDGIERIVYPKSYLYTTAINTALDEIKKNKRVDAFIAGEIQQSGHLLEEITPERVYLVRERFDLLARAMETLPDKQKEIVRRSRFLGQTYAEISAETGWSSADISRQLTAAMIIVQKRLKELSPKEEESAASEHEGPAMGSELE